MLALYRNGKRWLRLCYDAEVGEGQGYYYIDGSTHSASLGWGGSADHARAAFSRALRSERTELAYVSGWRVPPMEADGEAMTTAEFGRTFAPGQQWLRRHYGGEPELLTVPAVRHADLVFEGPRYLDFPKASRLRRCGVSIVVLDAEGKPQLTYTPCQPVSAEPLD